MGSATGPSPWEVNKRQPLSHISRPYATKLYDPLVFARPLSLLRRGVRSRAAPVHTLEQRRRAVGRVGCREQVHEAVLVTVPHAIRQDDGAVGG